MSKFNLMTTKEKTEYIGICILYPFMLLFGHLGKPLKLFGTRKKQITASVLSFVMFLSVVPVSAMTVFAENRSNTMTIQSKATGEVGFSNPMVGVGMNILPDYSKGSVYLGQYPQETSNGNNKSPVKWLTARKSTNINNLPVGTDTPEMTSPGAITLISEKVLDKSKYVPYTKLNKKPWSNVEHDGYSDSELKKFENNFYNSSFNPTEKATIALARVYSWGGGPYKSSYQPETVETYVYTPDSSDAVFPRYCEATEYAKSRGVVVSNKTAHYWYRSPATTSAYYLTGHIVQEDLSVGSYMYFAKREEYGVRPMTRLKDANIIMASFVGQKSSDCIVNAQSPTPDYELTLLDTARTFTATMSGKDEHEVITEECEALLGKIGAVAVEIKRTTDDVASYDKITVKSANKQAIEKSVADINVLLAASNLTEYEISSLENVKTTASGLLKVIADTTAEVTRVAGLVNGYRPESEIAEINKTKEVAKGLLTRISAANGVIEGVDVTGVNNITSENVKLNDKNALEKAKTALEGAYNDFLGNYTPTEKIAMQLRLDTINESLRTIANAEKTISAITELPIASNLKTSNKDAVYAAKAIYDALTDQEKRLVSAEYLEKLSQDIDVLTKSDKGNLPMAGKTNYLVLGVSLFIVSVGAITAVGVISKRKKNNQ